MVRYIEYERPMSFGAFKTECRATNDPQHYGITTSTRPTGQGCEEACVMVHCPEETRLEIAVEYTVNSSEVILRAEDNLEQQQSQEVVEKLQRPDAQMFGKKPRTAAYIARV